MIHLYATIVSIRRKNRIKYIKIQKIYVLTIETVEKI